MKKVLFLAIAILALAGCCKKAQAEDYTSGQWTFHCIVREGSRAIVTATDGLVTMKLASDLSNGTVVAINPNGGMTPLDASTMPQALLYGLAEADRGHMECDR